MNHLTNHRRGAIPRCLTLRALLAVCMLAAGASSAAAQWTAESPIDARPLWRRSTADILRTVRKDDQPTAPLPQETSPPTGEPPAVLKQPPPTSEPSILKKQPPVMRDPPPGPASQQPQRYGAEPEDAGLQFLRQSTVLLDPGEWQFDYGLVYTWQQDGFPVLLADATLDQAHLRTRTLLAPFGVRYGLNERTQLFAAAPVGWGHGELASREDDAFRAYGGVGDITVGFNRLLREGYCGSPDIVGTLGMVAPSGEHPFGTLPRGATGTGFWSVFGDVLFIHTYDPTVVFWGFGYRHYFERTLAGSRIQFGEEFTYQLGAGFAVNDRVTFSTAFLGSVFTETRVEGERVPGSVLEPLRIRMATTILGNHGKIIEPFVMFGITPDAPNAELGVIITRY